MKDLEQARKKDKEFFEEAIGKEIKHSEGKHEVFKEEMIKDMNEKLLGYVHIINKYTAGN
ncbi:hypothetical protein Tco_1023350, partial [Tanacetum coccineum]